CLGGAAAGALVVGFWPWSSPPAVSTNAPESNGTVAPVVDRGPAPVVMLDGNKAGPVWTIAFTPDGETLVVGAEDGSLNLWDWKKKTLRRALPKMGGNVWSVDVSNSGRFLVASSDDAEVKVYDLKSNTSS